MSLALPSSPPPPFRFIIIPPSLSLYPHASLSLPLRAFLLGEKVIISRRTNDDTGDTECGFVAQSS